MKLIKSGISAYQLKWIALIFMTVDHATAYIQGSSTIFITFLEVCGRIAAPIFLFAVTESLRFTKSKGKYVFRLYIAGVATNLFTIVTNSLFRNFLVFSPGNILYTYFYTALLVAFIDLSIMGVRSKKIKEILLSLLGIIAVFLPQALYWAINKVISAVTSTWTRIFITDIVNTIFPATFFVEYSLLFVVLGVFWYFAKSRKRQCIIFILFCLLSYVGSAQQKDLWPFNDFFAHNQYWMILALPFLLLYNGKKGKTAKLWFYVYYPIHRYILAFLSALLYS